VIEVVEQEHKYELDASKELPALEPAIGPTDRLERMGPVELDATYYDTEDGRLLRFGITLRQRSGGADAGWHLKVPGKDQWTRTEIRRPPGDPGVVEIPDELADLVFAVTRDRPLIPVARLHTSRTVSRVIDPRGESVVEVADDRVAAERLSDRTTKIWREIEVEEREGGSAAAARIRSLLHDHAIEESKERSKVARVLAERPRVDSEPSEDSSRRDILRRRLTEQIAELIARDLDFRRGDDEAVHTMRVASRRLRSCLQTFAPELPRMRSRVLDGELHWLAFALGRARDAQVMRERLQREATKLLAPAQLASVRAVLDLRLDAEVGEARSALGDLLRSPRYGALLGVLDDYVEHLCKHRKKACGSAGLFKYVEREARRTRQRIAKGQRTTGTRRNVELHKARKSAKRTRYAAETVVSVADKPAKRVVRRFEEIQELLGNRQDAVVERTLLASLAALTDETMWRPDNDTRSSLDLLARSALSEIGAVDANLEDLRRRARV
jgi:CHAD domain-containing protein